MKRLVFKIISFFLLLPGVVLADGTGIGQAMNIVNTTATDSGSYNTSRELTPMLGNIISAILSLLGGVFMIFIFYAGYLWMTASGNEQKVDKAKEILKESIIGLIVVLGAYTISYFVIKILGPQLNF
ncbi:MAG: pilin [Patescibacteria group bacterium]